MAACVLASVNLIALVPLSKCQSKLLLFPDHAVGDRPTSSPWQPSVLAQRKRQGPALNHVAKLPGFTVTREEEERRTAITKLFFSPSLNLSNNADALDKLQPSEEEETMQGH
ncbi:13-beta-glucan synthase component FKS1, partial [Dissostichus eleginoides]